MLMTRMTPKMSARPSATIAERAPDSTPEMITCPTISGVRTTVRNRSALVPGRRGEARLGLAELVRPHGDLLLALPLEGHHLVGELEPVLVPLVVAEGGLLLQLQQRLAHLVGVERPGALDALGVDEAAGVAGRRVVGGLVAELLLVGVEELLVARVRQRVLPLGGAVDVLGVLLERVVELRQV